MSSLSLVITPTRGAVEEGLNKMQRANRSRLVNENRTCSPELESQMNRHWGGEELIIEIMSPRHKLTVLVSSPGKMGPRDLLSCRAKAGLLFALAPSFPG